MYTHIIHISDIHLRTGNAEVSRYHEYRAVLKELVHELRELEPVVAGTAMVVVAGDIFHSKSRLESCQIKLWNYMIRSLANLAPVVLIAGNHDFSQSSQDTPDLIEALYEQAKHSQFKHPLHYLNETGTYVYDNIAFGLVDIKETLRSYDTRGIVDELPDFPKPHWEAGGGAAAGDRSHVNIALFHGSIAQTAYPNGQRVTAMTGYPLEWFKGYDLLLLGDVHLRHVETTTFSPDVPPLVWGYPGSLVQQDVGEHIYGHGYLLWDIAGRMCTAHHVHNDFGRFKAKIVKKKVRREENGEHEGGEQDEETRQLYVYADNGRAKHINEFCSLPWFPKTPIVTVIGNAGDEVFVSSELARRGIRPSGITTVANMKSVTGSGGDADGEGAGSGSDEDIRGMVQEIESINHPNQWLAYIEGHDAELADKVRAQDWLEHPQKLLPELISADAWGTVSAPIRDDIMARLDERRAKLEESIAAYTEARQSAVRRSNVVLKHMKWSWAFSYGAHNWFDFERMEGNIALLNGPNAAGKSSFIDTICIALFGRLNSNRLMNEKKRITAHMMHNKRPRMTAMTTRLLFEVAGESYELWRTYSTHGKQGDGDGAQNRECELYAVDQERKTKTLMWSGAVSVDAWVEQNCGRMEDVLMTTIVSQMDTHNFFWLNGKDQKKILDNALNLMPLQRFGDVLQTAHQAYDYLIKKLSDIVLGIENGASDVLAGGLSIEEAEEVQRELEDIKMQLESLEKQRDVLTAKAGDAADGCDTEGDEAYWKRILDEIVRTGGEPSDVTQLLVRQGALRERLAALEALEAPLASDSNAADERPSGVLAAELETLKREWRESGMGDVTAELNELEAWLSEHAKWVAQPEKAVKDASRAAKHLKALDKELQVWKLNAIAKPVAGDGSGGDGGGDDDSDEEVDWLTAATRYKDILEERRVIQAELDELRASVTTAVRDKSNFPAWQTRLKEWETICEDATENQWPSAAECAGYAKQARRSLMSWIERDAARAALVANLNAKLSAGNGGHCGASLSFESLEAARAALQKVEKLETELNALVQAEALDAEWRKEWKEWSRQNARCVKHGWDASALKEQLNELQERIQRVAVIADSERLLAHALAECGDCKFNPDCWACRANPQHKRRTELVKELRSLREELQGIAEDAGLAADVSAADAGAVRAALINQRDASAKAYDIAHAVEQKREAMTTHAALADERQQRMSTLRRRLGKYLGGADSGDELRRYVKHAEHEEQLNALRKDIAKEESALRKLGSRDELEELEQEWCRAAEVMGRIERDRDTMDAEREAWELAQKQWPQVDAAAAAMEAVNARLQAIDRDVARSHRRAFALWSARDQELQRDRDVYLQKMQRAQTFIAEFEGKRDRAQLLSSAHERQMSMQRLEQELQRRERAAALDELAQVDATIEQRTRFDRAAAAVAWYELQDVRSSLQSLDTRKTLLIKALGDGERTADRRASQGRMLGMLRALLTNWSERRDILSKTVARLVGDRVASQDTFKEWVYEKHIIPLIEKHVNAFLLSLDNIRLRVGYTHKSLQFFVQDRGNETTFAASSGYQQFIIGLAMRQALGNIGGTGRLQTVIIDEGFTACDATNIEKTHDILKRMIELGDFKSVIVVSHLDTIKEGISNKVNIVRDGSISTLQYGSAYPDIQHAGVKMGATGAKRGRPRKT